MVVVYTGRISLTDHPDAIDTTMASGDGVGKILVPTRQLVYGYKAGQGDSRFANWSPLTEDQYTTAYLDLLRNRFSVGHDQFRQVLDRDRVILLCYCAAEGFCHRYILAETVLPKCADHFQIDYAYGGEWA